MAIGNSGGSAATRFRPRGTAVPGGLGRRNLLAEDSDATESAEDSNEAAQEDSVSTPQYDTAPKNTLGTRPQRTRTVGQTVSSPSAESEPQTATLNENASAAVDSSTSTDPSPSPTTRTSARRGRGRPARTSTPSVDAQSSSNDSQTALSVSGARARMREIEQQVKQARTEHTAEMAAVDRAFRERMQPLQSEYEALNQTITALTFGL